MFCIEKHVIPGTNILSNGWKGYNNVALLPSYDYEHDWIITVFADPLTGAPAYTIEGKWNGLKKAIPKNAYLSNVIETDGVQFHEALQDCDY